MRWRGRPVCLSRATIALGIRELRDEVPQAPAGRVRRPGGGRKSLEAHDPTLRADLERLVEPTSRGDPESPLRWTCKSVRRLARELQAQGHQVSYQKVDDLLHALGHSLQATRKTQEGADGTDHPDRDGPVRPPHRDRSDVPGGG